MSTPVTAVVATRPTSTDVEGTLAGLLSQTRVPAHVVVAVAGEPTALIPTCERVLGDAVAWRIVSTPDAANLGVALSRALSDGAVADAFARSDWLWILHEDSVPEPSCLEEMLRVADAGRTIGVVGAKQLAADGRHLIEVGIRATRSARRLSQVAPDEIDQGQYDDVSDVLAVGTAGMLVARDTWQRTGGLDPALGPFGDGLEFSRRVRRAGERVVVAPKARVRHARRSLYGQQDPAATPDPSRSFTGRRSAQIYNWMLAAPLWQAPLIALAMVVWAPLRAIWRLLRGRRDLAGAEMRAWGRSMLRTPALVRARRRLSRQSVVPASVLASLEASPGEITSQARRERRFRRLEDGDGTPSFSERLAQEGATVWTPFLAVAVLAIASLIGFRTMLGGIEGAAWADAPASWSALWHHAWSAIVPGGDGFSGPADPFVGLMALATAPFALIGLAPTAVMTWLLLLALPLSFAAFWWAARAVCDSRAWLLAVSLVWACSPTLIAAIAQGRLSAALFHVAVPLVASGWIRVARPGGALEGRPSTPTPGWGGAALAGYVCVACVPWTLVPLLVGAACVALMCRRSVGRRAWGIVLSTVPALIAVAPTVIAAVMKGTWALRGLLADGGGQAATDPVPSWLLTLGVPATLSQELAPALAIWPGVLVLGAYVAALLLSDPVRRVRVAASGLAAALALAVAVVLQHVTIGADAVEVRAWAGPAVSIAWLLFLLAGTWAWTHIGIPRRARITAPVAAVVGLAALACTAPLSPHPLADADVIRPAAVSAVPAVGLQAQASTRATRNLVVTAQDGFVRAQVLSGERALITDLSGVRAAANMASDADPGLAAPARADLLDTLAVLLEFPDEESVRSLASHGIDTITVAPSGNDSGDLLGKLEQAPGLETIGTIDGYAMWRVRPDGWAPSRIYLARADDSGPVSSRTEVPSSLGGADAAIEIGRHDLVGLAQAADDQWSATLDGQRLTPVVLDGWAQGFELPAGAREGRLVISAGTGWSLAWWIALGAALAVSAVFAFPTRRSA